MPRARPGRRRAAPRGRVRPAARRAFRRPRLGSGCPSPRGSWNAHSDEPGRCRRTLLSEFGRRCPNQRLKPVNVHTAQLLHLSVGRESGIFAEPLHIPRTCRPASLNDGSKTLCMTQTTALMNVPESPSRSAKTRPPTLAQRPSDMLLHVRVGVRVCTCTSICSHTSK